MRVTVICFKPERKENINRIVMHKQKITPIAQENASSICSLRQCKNNSSLLQDNTKLLISIPTYKPLNLECVHPDPLFVPSG
ncbi:hypothetical protein Hanom_Chr05g00420801 [Helianthus anomalus]